LRGAACSFAAAATAVEKSACTPLGAYVYTHYVYTHKHTHTHTHIHRCIISIYKYLCVCVCICMCIYMHTCMYVYVYTYVYVCMYVYTYVCMYVCTVHTYCVLTNPPIPSLPCDHIAKNKNTSFYITREGTYVHYNIYIHKCTNPPPHPPTHPPTNPPTSPPTHPPTHTNTSETMRVHDTTKTSSDTPRDSDNSHVEPTGPLRSAQVSNEAKKHVSKEC